MQGKVEQKWIKEVFIEKDTRVYTIFNKTILKKTFIKTKVIPAITLCY